MQKSTSTLCKPSEEMKYPESRPNAVACRPTGIRTDHRPKLYM